MAVEVSTISAVKKKLQKTIDRLSNEEARQIFEFTRRLREKSAVTQTLKALAYDTAFTVPPASSTKCCAVRPIKGKGILASRLLVMD